MSSGKMRRRADAMERHHSVPYEWIADLLKDADELDRLTKENERLKEIAAAFDTYDTMSGNDYNQYKAIQDALDLYKKEFG